MDFADRWWTSEDGLRLHARDYPGATGQTRLPVICIHGLTRNARDFEDLAPHITASGRRVLALDVRGRGLSDRDPDKSRYRPDVYARDVAGFMADSGIDRAVFIGTSMGGLITMALAGLRPKLIAAAVLNDVGPELSPIGIGRILSYVGKPLTIGSWDEAAAYIGSVNASALPHYTAADWMKFARRTFREEDGKPVRDYDPAVFSAPPPANPKAVQALAWTLFRKLARKRPLLLIRGEITDLITPETAAKMRKAAPHMVYAEVPGVGHAPMLDEPAALAAIDLFLSCNP